MKFHCSKVLIAKLRCVFRGKLTESSRLGTRGQLMRRIVPSNFSLVTRRTRRSIVSYSVRVTRRFAWRPLSIPFPSRPYNTHQRLVVVCPLASLSLRGHCSRCGRSIKGLDGNSQLNASPNGCEEDSARKRARRGGVPLSGLLSRSRRLPRLSKFKRAAPEIPSDLEHDRTRQPVPGRKRPRNGRISGGSRGDRETDREISLLREGRVQL